MRIRFSLRTSFLLVTLLAILCYFWFVMPSRSAQRFLAVIAAEDYQLADQFFRDPGDRFIANSADKYWGFSSQADLLPTSIGQILTGRRRVHLRLAYFHLDQHVDCNANIVVTAFGLSPPVISTRESAIIIERGTAVPVE